MKLFVLLIMQKNLKLFFLSLLKVNSFHFHVKIKLASGIDSRLPTKMHRASGIDGRPPTKIHRASGIDDRFSTCIGHRRSVFNVHRASKVGFQQPSIVHRRSSSKSFTYIVHRPWNGPTVGSLDLCLNRFYQQKIFCTQ